MKNKLSVLLALLFLLCTAMCCEEFEEYIPCQVTLTGIGKVEHLDNAGSVPIYRLSHLPLMMNPILPVRM